MTVESVCSEGVKKRSHKAHHHDGRCGGGLDHRRDPRAQQHAPQGGAGKAVEHQLQLIARHALEPVAHEGHAEQEQRYAAAKGNDV